MFRVVREESDFLVMISLLVCVISGLSHSWFLDSRVCSSKLLYRLN